MITVEQMVSREVHYCVSYLVNTLAKHDGQSLDLPANDDLAQMTEQAFELASPIDDWEEAAREAGFKPGRFFWYDANKYPSGSGASAAYDAGDAYEGDAQHICAAHDIDPYQREVYEHWIVSDWLADRLAERGEKVDKDFAGMTVWARTTTGQGIAADGVIQAIHAALASGESV